MSIKTLSAADRKKVKSEISDLLLKVRATYAVTQEEIGTELGVHPTTISGWETKNSSCQTYEIYNRVSTHLKDLLGGVRVLKRVPLAGRTTPDKPTPDKPTPDKPTIVGALSTQIGGSHYKDCAIQPIEYTEANNLQFLEASIVKRVTRHDKPTGKGREDIEKVIHEATLLLEFRYSTPPYITK